MCCGNSSLSPAPELVQLSQSSRDIWRGFQRCNWYVGVDFLFTNAGERHFLVWATVFITATRSRTLQYFCATTLKIVSNTTWRDYIHKVRCRLLLLPSSKSITPLTDQRRGTLR